MRNVIAGTLVAALVLGATAVTEAGGFFAPEIEPRVGATPPAIVHPVPRPRPFFTPHARHARRSNVIVAPLNVFVFAPYAAPSSCYVPGYWTYQWVPQTYSSNVWMDGQWTPAGTWIDGHYEQRVYSSGYYQQIWIDGGYGC